MNSHSWHLASLASISIGADRPQQTVLYHSVCLGAHLAPERRGEASLPAGILEAPYRAHICSAPRALARRIERHLSSRCPRDAIHAILRAHGAARYACPLSHRHGPALPEAPLFRFALSVDAAVPRPLACMVAAARAVLAHVGAQILVSAILVIDQGLLCHQRLSLEAI